jgi:hypothetical protein
MMNDTPISRDQHEVRDWNYWHDDEDEERLLGSRKLSWNWCSIVLGVVDLVEQETTLDILLLRPMSRRDLMMMPSLD